MTGFTWPGFYPEDCPSCYEPEEPSGVFFRLVKDTPAQEDFISFAEKRPNKTYSDQCKASGLSVFKKAKDAKRARKISKALRKKKLASGTLTPADGLIKQTGTPSHHTWWVPSGLNVSASFSLVEPEGGGGDDA